MSSNKLTLQKVEIKNKNKNEILKKLSVNLLLKMDSPCQLDLEEKLEEIFHHSQFKSVLQRNAIKQIVSDGK